MVHWNSCLSIQWIVNNALREGGGNLLWTTITSWESWCAFCQVTCKCCCCYWYFNGQYISQILSWCSLIGKKTLCHPIQSILLLVIKKQTPTSHLSHFVNHLHDYKMNWTPLSPINITTKLFFWSRAKQGPSVRLHDHTYCQLQCTIKLITNELCTVKPVLCSTILSWATLY